MEADVKLDCYGVLCPVPIIQTNRKLRGMKVGEVLEITSTDAGIKDDMPAWCRMSGQEYLGAEEDGGLIRVYIRKVKD